MKNGRILLLLLLTLFIYTPLTYAEETDPCSAITGNWRGEWRGSDCFWDARVEASQYNDVLRFITDLKVKSGYCNDGSFVMVGSCKNGEIKFKNYKGYIIDGVITLQHSPYEAVLRKE